MATIESAVRILNPHMPLAQPAEPQQAEIDVPDPIRNLLQADVFPDADGGDVHPPTVPPNAAVGTG